MKTNDNTQTGDVSPMPLDAQECTVSPSEAIDSDTLQCEKNSPDTGDDKDDSGAAREHTRSKMALVYVLGFFSIIYLCFLYAIIMKSSLNDLKEILVAVIGALSSTLGFIVGYYYKSTQER